MNCSNCGKEVSSNDKYCDNCGAFLNSEFMKKASTPFHIIGFIIIWTIFLILTIIILKKTNTSFYRIVIVADNCDCVIGLGQKCRFTYGVNKKGLEDIWIYKKDDKSNIYKVVVSNDIKVYLDQDTYYKMYKENGNRTPIEYNLLKKYQLTYKYNKTDKKMFGKIIKLIDEDELEHIENYIVTENNYYIFNPSSETLYLYDIKNNKLIEYLKIEECNINYFHEK